VYRKYEKHVLYQVRYNVNVFLQYSAYGLVNWCGGISRVIKYSGMGPVIWFLDTVCVSSASTASAKRNMGGGGLGLKSRLHVVHSEAL
jgi:hypothetical protein